MTVSLDIIVTQNTADDLFARVATALSPAAMAAFLVGSVSPYLAQRGSERFSQEGDDVTGPWAPLAESTVGIREEAGFGGEHPINIRTGEMERWVTQPSPGVGVGAVLGDVGAMMEWPSPIPSGALGDKVAYAQNAKARIAGGGNTQATPRAVVGVNEKDLLHVTAQLMFYLQAAG